MDFGYTKQDLEKNSKSSRSFSLLTTINQNPSMGSSILLLGLSFNKQIVPWGGKP